MTITFDMWTISLAVATSLIGLVLKPLFRNLTVFKREIPLSKFLPWLLAIITMGLSLAMNNTNVATAIVRGLTASAIACLGYDGVKGLLYKKKV